MCALADYAHCQMSMTDWFTMVHPSGGTRFEMLDQDDPGSWVVDPAGHRATYSGRIMEDRVDSLGHLTEGVLRTVYIDLVVLDSDSGDDHASM